MKISKQVYEYVSDTQNYDLEEVLEKLTHDIKEFKNINISDCGVHYEGSESDYLMYLDDYTIQVFKKSCELLVNVIESFESEEY